MRGIKWVGFNFMHNLCLLKDTAFKELYRSAAEHLVKEYHYPDKLLERQFDPDFAIRGLLFDTRNGILMKSTFLSTVLSGAAFLGRQQVDDSTLGRLYPGMNITQADLRAMKHFADPYGRLDATLVSDIIQLFHETGRSYHPHYVYQDVMHTMSVLQRGNIETKHIAPKNIHDLLLSLRNSGRKTFMLTNQAFPFVDKALQHLMKPHMKEPENWPSLFDVSICSAARPSWWLSDAPFRSLNTVTQKTRWIPVTELRQGHVYVGGSFLEFMRLANAGGSSREVLYMTAVTSALPHIAGGDPIQDLALPSSLGWRTGAVIPEVDVEVESVGSAVYKKALVKLLDLERSSTQDPHEQYDSASCAELLQTRDALKAVLNKNFGSAFRSLGGHTHFAHQLLRFADVYTGKAENLRIVAESFLRPLRRSLPHEPFV